ncbi:Gfo/Idh/MocA family oxidoreductase [Clostridium sp. BNL1100]|uniref:Gfo/Idh/MocA family protein n=1 Tax=Clostridium sp. BNL1100 TaxID=755731 RepID=UPI00024A7195|nr:Gfo/Idh/MocA family oxidoreductase [Clostridium sp. BNL1100]AEY66778.1 putative dehydrogenase [Clostridium sp. BNL1100]
MIGVGIVGCGAIARYRHVPEFAANPLSKIIGYFNPSSEKAEILASKYGGKVYSDYGKMLEDPAVQAVCICSPNKYHAQMSIAAMEAGKHVLCEKPIAVTVDEGEKMLEAAARTKKCLMIAHDMKFEYAHKKAREIVKSGEMGRILSFRTTFGHRGPEHWSVNQSMDSWFFDNESSLTGVLADLGVHKLNLIEWLIDDRINQIKAFSEVRDKKRENGELVETPDNSVCLLKSKSGIIGTLAASWTYYGGMDKSTVLYCSKGTIEIYSNPGYPLIVAKSENERICYTFDKQETSGIADAFLDSIVNGTDPAISGEEGLRALKLVMACAEAHAKDKTILIND